MPRAKGAKTRTAKRAKSDTDRARKTSAAKNAAPKTSAPKKRRPVSLSTRQRAYMRGLGHHLQPVVMLGKDGISDGLLQALDTALDQHELVKVRLSENAPGERPELASSLAEQSAAALVQVLGRLVLLYRRRPDPPRSARPTIQLPANPA